MLEGASAVLAVMGSELKISDLRLKTDRDRLPRALGLDEYLIEIEGVNLTGRAGCMSDLIDVGEISAFDCARESECECVCVCVGVCACVCV